MHFQAPMPHWNENKNCSLKPHKHIIIEIRRVYNCSYFSAGNTARRTYVNCQFTMTSMYSIKWCFHPHHTSTRHQDMHGHTFQRKSLARLHCALGIILTPDFRERRNLRLFAYLLRSCVHHGGSVFVFLSMGPCVCVYVYGAP